MDNVINLVLHHAYDGVIDYSDLVRIGQVSKYFQHCCQDTWNIANKRLLMKHNDVIGRPVVHIQSGNCVMCSMYTNTKCDNKYMCNHCIKRTSLTSEEAKRKWKLPLDVIHKVNGVLVKNTEYYPKKDIVKTALEYHRGPKNLSIAIVGKGKYTRQKALEKIIHESHLKNPQIFSKLDDVNDFLLSGKHGIRVVKSYARKWNDYVQFVNDLPKGDHKFIKLIDCFKLYLDHPLQVHMHVNDEKIKHARKKQWKYIALNSQLWSDEERDTFLQHGDSTLHEKIECREQRLQNIMENIPSMSYNKLLNCAKNILIDDTINVVSAITKCRELEFLHDFTYYPYFKRRNNTQNSSFDDEKAKIRALKHYFAKGDASLIPKSLLAFTNHGQEERSQQAS